MSTTAVDLGRAELESRAPARAESLFSWGGAIGLLVLVVWAVPIKSYRLPVALPFSLELYRLVLIVCIGAWLVAIVTGTPRRLGRRAREADRAARRRGRALDRGEHSTRSRAPACSRRRSSRSPTSSASCVAYLLVCSTIQSLSAVELVVRVLVLGAAAIAVAAIYEARTNYNVFDHLHKWFSFLEPTRAIKESAERGTRLRVRASAQHPIALGAALTMALPLAVYLATRARDAGSAPSSGARPACSASSAR